MNTEEYDRLDGKIDHLDGKIVCLDGKIDAILAILERKTKRKSTQDDSRLDLTYERVKEIERLFWHIVNTPRTKRRDSYRRCEHRR